MVFSPTQVKFGYAKSDVAARVLQASASSCAIAGASARRTDCCARRTATPGSTTCARAQALFRARRTDRREVDGAAARTTGRAPATDVSRLAQRVVRRVTLAAWLLVAFLGLCAAAVPAHAAEEEARVLILNGADPYLPAYLAIDSAMRASLAQETARRIVFFSEPLDAQRFPVEALEPELLALLAKKYSATAHRRGRGDQLTALDFFKRHGAQIWPGARLVFHGWPGEEFESAALPPDATGVVTHTDVGGTIDLARRLQPGARRIVVVSGASDFDRRVEQLARAGAVERGPDSRRWSSFPACRCRNWSPGWLRSQSTRSSFISRSFATGTADRTRRAKCCVQSAPDPVAPVYGLVETYIGFGTAAGSVESYEATGRLVGEQVRAALGRAARTRTAPCSKRRADALRTRVRCSAGRWTSGVCPNGCEIRFADRPFWRQYWWQIAVTLAVIVGQALLIAALFFQRRRRRLAEQAEQAQRVELAHASRLAMAGELTGAIAHEINQPLGAILSNTDAADLILESGTDRRDELRGILADIRRDDLRASEVIHRLRALLGKDEFEQGTGRTQRSS